MYIADRIKILKKSFYVFIIAILLLSSSCFNESDYPSLPDNADPLFNHTDLGSLSIFSGNMHFGSFLTSDSGYIFFHSKDNTGLIRSDYKGDNPIVISDKLPGFISTAGDMVFFTDGVTGGNIYKVNNEGEGQSIASSGNSKYVISQFDYIYYINIYNKYSYRTKHDGSNPTEIIKYSTDEIIIINGNIYILVNDISLSENSLIFEIDLDYIRNMKEPVSYPFAGGSDDIKVYEMNYMIKHINASEHYIFYSKNGNIHKINKESQKISDTKIKSSFPFIVSEDYIYFINEKDNFRVYRANIDRLSDKKIIVNDMVSDFVVCGNSIYYRRSKSNDIYRTPAHGGISSKIT